MSIQGAPARFHRLSAQESDDCVLGIISTSAYMTQDLGIQISEQQKFVEGQDLTRFGSFKVIPQDSPQDILIRKRQTTPWRPNSMNI